MSVVSSTTSDISTRLLDANNELLNTLTPLCGYADKPYVSLEEAVKPLCDIVSNVGVRVWTAMDRSKNRVETLTHNELAAITLYTIEWDPSHPSLYSILNSTLRLENRDALKPWFSYLKLLLSGLFKLPSMQCLAWRGVKENLISNYKVGEYYTWWAFSSCTTSISMLMSERYLGKANECTLFAIECSNGKDIKRCSYFSKEDEILLLPCTHFKVINKLTRLDGLNIIHLREEPSPHMLLEPPFPISTESVSDKLNSKQYQAIIEKLTKEKEHLENRCANREEELINIQAMISCINEDNECLMKINESLNQENKRLRRENQCIKEESKISTLNIEDSKNDSTEIQRTIKCLTISNPTPSVMTSNKIYRYNIPFTIHTVDAKHTRFEKTGDLYINIHLFNDHKQTKLMKSSLPLLFEETLVFTKVFENCNSPTDIIDRLKDENILIELCQTINDQSICLAIKDVKAKELLYPYSSNTIEYTNFRRTILLNSTNHMSNISPTFTFSVNPKVNEISATK